MTEFRRVTDRFSVSPQMTPRDMDAAAAEGFTLIVNNRPDGEVPDQPPAAAMEAAARAAGMDYVDVPVAGRPTAEQVEAMHAAVSAARGPVLAFCRTGTRSISVWSLGQALLEGQDRAELVRLGGDAGYDLSGLLG